MQARFGITNKLLKIAAWAAGIVLLLLVSFHIWFINHSEKTIEELIAWQSNGKLKATIKKFSIDYINNNAEINELFIFNTDTSGQSASYRFSTKELKFNIRSKWDFLFHKQLLVDSIIFASPDIVVTRKSQPQKDSTKKKLLIAEELGNVYKTINRSLAVLNLAHFEITEGNVLIKDVDTTIAAPLRVSHIFLLINNLDIDSAKTINKDKFIFSERAVLRIGGQVIKLADNKSSINFSGLLIDSKQKSIQITNPGIHILPPEGQKNSFITSAEKLNITGLDFNALYKQPLIKVDSVYIESPQGDLQVYANKKNKTTDAKKRKPLDSALSNLPVAIEINHVVMQNANGAMRLHRAAKTTSFKTKNDNLSISGIRINDMAAKVLSIDGFNYTVRNYIGYTPDSVYRFGFDSLQFIDNKIVLYNFTATTIKTSQASLIRDYHIPRFEITDMDWLSFIFYNHFKAQKAVLYNPVINIEKKNAVAKNAATANGKRSIYQTLSVMDNVLDLDQLQIINGQVAAKQGNNFSIRLQKLNLNINANELTEATSFKQLVHSVKELSFDTAIATNPLVVLHIARSYFSNKDESLLLKNVLLNTGNNSITASLNNVAVSNFSFDNNELEVNGIRWKEGAIHIVSHNKKEGAIKTGDSAPLFLLNNISAHNTAMFFKNEKIQAQVFLKNVSTKSLNKSADNPVEISGLLVEGEYGSLNFPGSQLTCSSLTIQDEEKSILKNIVFKHIAANDTALIEVPEISFIPFLNKTISINTIVADSVELEQPKIFLAGIKNKKQVEYQTNPVNIPGLHINVAAVKNASLYLSAVDEKRTTVVECKQLSVSMQDISTQADESLLLDSVQLFTGTVSFNQNNGVAVRSNGNIDVSLNNFLFYPETRNWQMQLDKLLADSIQYTDKINDSSHILISINKLTAGYTIVKKDDLKKALPWFINQSKANVAAGFISLKNSNSNVAAIDFQFNGSKQNVSIDSFSIDPGQSRDSFVNQLVYRKDYMSASSGKIVIEGIEMKDKLFHARHISSSNAILNVYSDKLKPAGEDGVQPLPLAAIKNISTELQLDTIILGNMAVNYTELNAATKQTGHVNFTNLKGNILNVSSAKRIIADSLRVDVHAKFLDTMWLHLIMNESYSDPLNGLSLQLQLGPGDIRLLNPFLGPLVSVNAKSGYLDTMSMLANGNDYIAHGTMQLYYHGLKTTLLDSGNTHHRKFGTKLLTFFANSIAIRNNNDKRHANFTFTRIRQKSSIAFFLKMIVQGAAGNVMPTVSKIIFGKEPKKAAKKNALQKTNDNP